MAAAASAKASRDLRIYYSMTNPKPEENNCDGFVENTACLSIDSAEDRFF